MSEKESLIKEIIEIQRKVNQALRQDVPDVWMGLNLTVPQLKSLFFIINEGGTNSRKLAGALKVTPSNITGIIDRLVEQGLVTRSENPEDRRMIRIQATEKGKALVADLRERETGHLAGALARMNTEQLSALYQGLTALFWSVETGKKKA